MPFVSETKPNLNPGFRVRQTDRERDSQTIRAGRQAGRQKDRETDRGTETDCRVSVKPSWASGQDHQGAAF